MTVKLFKAFLLSAVLFFVLLLTCRTFCVIASAHNYVKPPTATTTTTPTTNTISLFKPDETEFAQKKSNGDNDGEGQKKKYQSFTSPFIVCVDDVLVVFAQAKNTTGDKKSDVVEGYVEFKDDSLNKLFAQLGGGSSWKKRVVITKESTQTEIFTNVAKENSIYVFFKNVSDTERNDKWEYNLINGTVNDGKVNSITWNGSVTNITDTIKTSDSTSQTADLFGGGGPGIIVNKTLVVPLWYKKDESNNIFTIITNTSGVGKEWKLVSSTATAEGIHPAVVEWEGKLIMMTSSRGGTRKVYESTDMGNKWTEGVGSISNVWGNTKKREPNQYGGKGGFITAEIKDINKKVILVTQPVEAENKYKLHLWLTDYKRVCDVGAISDEIQQNISSTLLYAKGNLFAAYEQWDNGNSTINITHLNNELGTIKKTLETWKTQDDLLAKSCFAADGTLTNGDKYTNKIPTNGLVGYLSGNYSDNNWADEYLCVNATVNNNNGGVTSVSGGVQFSGGGAGAVWPVGAQGQNQRYHFANYNFTLLATVTINDDAANEKCNSVLGVTINGGGDNSNKRIGLWCGREGKWGVGDGAESTKVSTGEEKCEKGKTYEVALIMKNKTVDAYINGNLLSSQPNESMKIDGLQNVTHFYFGAYNGDNKENNVDSHVTVRNVLLYNFPFSDDDIKKINIPVVVQGERPQKPPSNDTPADTAAEDTGTSSNAPQSPEGIKNDDEGERTKSQSESSTVRGCVSVTALLVFFGLWAHTSWIL